jgi:hypothetical protein
MRTKIGKYYVSRDRIGRIKKWVSIKRSLARDRGTKARTKVKSGYGDQGDIVRDWAYNY